MKCPHMPTLAAQANKQRHEMPLQVDYMSSTEVLFFVGDLAKNNTSVEDM